MSIYNLDYDNYRMCNDYYYPCKPQKHSCSSSCSSCCSCCAIEGKSAYQIAVEHGFIGTEQEWLDSLKGASEPFLSSYIEAVGREQTVAANANVVFDTDPETLDVVGTDIRLNRGGSVFTIYRSGLYRVEWSMNYMSAYMPSIVGILENGQATSVMSNDQAGNFSSGALIYVAQDEVPYTVELHNFGQAFTSTNPSTALNSAVSIRISRFADAPYE